MIWASSHQILLLLISTLSAYGGGMRIHPFIPLCLPRQTQAFHRLHLTHYSTFPQRYPGHLFTLLDSVSVRLRSTAGGGAFNSLPSHHHVYLIYTRRVLYL